MHAPPILSNILTESAPDYCPCTSTATLLPMNKKRVILLIPVAQLFVTQKASDAILVLPAWYPIEACFGKSVRVGVERGRMGPLHGCGSRVGL